MWHTDVFLEAVVSQSNRTSFSPSSPRRFRAVLLLYSLISIVACVVAAGICHFLLLFYKALASYPANVDRPKHSSILDSSEARDNSLLFLSSFSKVPFRPTVLLWSPVSIGACIVAAARHATSTCNLHP